MDFEDPPIDSSELASGFGMPSIRAANADELEQALAKSFAAPGPMLIEAMVEKGP